MTLTLKIVNKFFYMTLHLIIRHHHSKSGKKKWLSSSGDIVQTQSDTRMGWQTDRQTEGWSNSNTTTPNGGGGGVKKKQHFHTCIFLNFTIWSNTVHHLIWSYQLQLFSTQWCRSCIHIWKTIKSNMMSGLCNKECNAFNHRDPQSQELLYHDSVLHNKH